MVESPAQTSQAPPVRRHVNFRVVVAALALIVSYFLLLRNVANFILWGALSFGAVLDQSGLPSGDAFSYTAAGAERIYLDWGSSALFYRLLTDGGDASLFVLKVLLLVASLLIAAGIFRAATEDLQSPLAAAAFFAVGLPGCYILLAAYAGTIDSAALSVLVYLGFLWILDTYHRTPVTRAPWLLPPLTALWVNLDGDFVLGFLVIGLHLLWLAVERRKKQASELAIVALFCLGATLINPYGWQVVGASLTAWTTPSIVADGWRAVAGNDSFVWAYVGLAVTGLSAAAFGAWRARLFPGVLLLLAGTAMLGWRHIEHTPYFVFTMMALGVPEMLRLVDHAAVPTRIQSLFGLLIPAGVGAAAATLLVLQLATVDDVLRPQTPAWNAAVGSLEDPDYYPIGAVSFLSEGEAPVNLWCQSKWSGFVAWSLYPRVRISMDHRQPALYPESVRADYVRFWGPGREASAAGKYDTTHILVAADDAATRTALDASEWRLAYEDPVAVIYARSAPATLPAARPNDGGYVGDFIGDLSRFTNANR